MVLQNLGDGARGQARTQLAEFTLDAPVAPPRVLGGQAQDECGRLVVDWRTTWWATRIRPAFRHQPAVPGQQGPGGHAEGPPRRTGKQTTERGRQATIYGLGVRQLTGMKTLGLPAARADVLRTSSPCPIVHILSGQSRAEIPPLAAGEAPQMPRSEVTRAEVR